MLIGESTSENILVTNIMDETEDIHRAKHEILEEVTRRNNKVMDEILEEVTRKYD